ncbi:SpoIIE family protein phosphatase [Streptomyces shenzhenensis]|uniref:SpoIIE family protein phosphatase n=1 Tax=Streptomyces shenzhenensis TaxID=943815 RepID=UPI00340D1BD6
MDCGTEGDAPPGPVAGDGATGRIPLAVVVADRNGLVSHWSTGARRLFGATEEEAVGRFVLDLLPVSGALPDDAFTLDGAYAADDQLGPDLESSLDGRLNYPAAGRARLSVPERGRADVLWWAYPLVGQGDERLLVLAADAELLCSGGPDGGSGAAAFERIAPGFALHTDFPGADELARRLPGILPGMSVAESARIVAQVLELGYPVLEFSQSTRVPVTPDWSVARRTERPARHERAARAAAQGLPVPEKSVAEPLRDSVLPHIPPRRAGCDLAIRRLSGTRAGGDWFDSVKLPGARTALVVGDVMGHGLDSAAMTVQLRTAVQTMAALDLPPAQLLRNLDGLAQRLGDNYLATCVYAVYDPIESELRIADAGHVPPVLVRADGRSDLLDLPTGAPIGVGGVPFEEVRVRVAPGDRLVMCTDALVEVRGADLGVGLAKLCESAAHPAASMDDACDTIVRALGARGGRKDDVALLMARLNGIAPKDVAEWRLGFDPAEVGRARAAVREQLHDWDLARLTDSAELMVGELVTNAVRHARSRPIRLRLVRGDTLLCAVDDDDHTLPTLLSAGPGDESGRGLRVVSTLAREWGTSRTTAGKTVWFELTPGRR